MFSVLIIKKSKENKEKICGYKQMEERRNSYEENLKKKTTKVKINGKGKGRESKSVGIEHRKKR